MRKYFLIFISFCILQQTYAMERENKTTRTLRTLYATVANYLPAFSFSSFIARYIRKQNTLQEHKQEGAKPTFLSFFTKFFSNFTFNVRKKDVPLPEEINENQNNSVDINSYKETPFFISSLMMPFVDAIEAAQENNFDQEEDLKKIREYSKTNFETLYLKNFFKNNQQYAVKYEKYELNRNFFDVIKIAKKNRFKQEDDLEKIKNCINQGADPGYPVELYGKLVPAHMVAVVFKQEALFRFLLQKGANINVCDKKGKSILHAIIDWQTFDDSDVNIRIKNLLQSKANVNALDKKGEGPLFTAVGLRKKNTIKSLIEYRADVNQVNVVGVSPLTLAINYEKDKEPNIVTLLYKNTTSLLDVDSPTYSIFHFPALITNDKLLKAHISAIIKYTQDAYKEEDLQSRKRFEEMYNILGKINNRFPSEVRCLILAMLPENHFLGSDFTGEANTFGLLIKNDAQGFALYRVMNQMRRIQALLVHKNELYHSIILNKQDQKLVDYAKTHVNAVKNFCNENKPREDFIKFLEAFPDPVQENPDDNWAGMAYRYLLENK